MSKDDSFFIRTPAGVAGGSEMKTEFVNLAVIPNGHHLTRNQKGEEELFLQLPSGGQITLTGEEAKEAWARIKARAGQK